MSFLKETYEFDAIINDITNHARFQELKMELHHGISRYEHSLRVAKMTYYMTKFLQLDYERATRAALLHDFFFNEDMEKYTTSEVFRYHQYEALKNAQECFDIDSKQANMIETHMFPVCHEMYRYKAALTMGIWIIFLFNIITIQK